MPLIRHIGYLLMINVIVVTSVSAQCDVQTTGLSFGKYNRHKTSVSTADITITCLPGVAYEITLHKGHGVYPRRQMRGSGGGSGSKGGALYYNLFTRPDHTGIWGDGISNGTLTRSGVGNGKPQIFTIFAQIPAGQKAKPGQYSDSIPISIMF